MIKRYSLILTIIVVIVLAQGCSENLNHIIAPQIYSSYNVERIKTSTTNNHITGIFKLTNNDSKIVCQEVEYEGYSGTIRSLVYIDMDKEVITKVVVLEHTETMDYGGYVTEDWFLDRYSNKFLDKQLNTVIMVAKEDNDVVAITGATITSDAVTSSVNEAILNFHLIKPVLLEQ